MRALPHILLLIASGIAAAEPQQVVIDAVAGRVETGNANASELLAYAGSDLEIRWRSATDETVPVALHQITSSRKMGRTASEVEIEDGEGIWRWTVPESRGIARYRIELGTEPPAVLHLTAHDRAAHEKIWQALGKGSLEVSGFFSSTAQALRALGLRPKVASDPQPSLTFRGSGQPARQIRFQNEDPHRTVWIASPGENGPSWKIIAPLSWLDADRLATDEGKIRLLTLLTENPDITPLP